MALTKITSDILADEFNTTGALTAGATVNVDFKDAEVLTKDNKLVVKREIEKMSKSNNSLF